MINVMAYENPKTGVKWVAVVAAFLVAGALGFGLSIFGPGPALNVFLVGIILLLVTLLVVKPRRAWLITLSAGLIVGSAIYLGLAINTMLTLDLGEWSVTGTATPI